MSYWISTHQLRLVDRIAFNLLKPLHLFWDKMFLIQFLCIYKLPSLVIGVERLLFEHAVLYVFAASIIWMPNPVFTSLNSFLAF